MAKRQFHSSEDVGGESKQLKKPGTYHCSIRQCRDGQTTSGKPINGVSAILTVLAGTESDEVDHEFHLHLFDPNLSASEKAQEWAIKKQTAFGVAINEINPADLGKGLELDFEAGEGQQIFATFDENEHNGEVNLQVSYANLYHVDDPRAAKFPKNENALKMIPKDLRKSADWFAPLMKHKGEAVAAGNANGNGAAKSRLTENQLADL